MSTIVSSTVSTTMPLPSERALQRMGKVSAMSIYRRGHIFWWRRRLTIPASTVDDTDLVGEKSHAIRVRISLKTSDLAEARKRAAALELEMHMVAVKFPSETAAQPKQLQAVFDEALMFKRDHIAALQSQPPFDPAIHQLYNSAYAKLFDLMARTGTMPTPQSAEAQALLADSSLSDSERGLLKELLSAHIPRSMREEQLDKHHSTTTTSPMGKPAIAPHLLKNYMENAKIPYTASNTKMAFSITASAYATACKEANAALTKPIGERSRSSSTTMLARAFSENEAPDSSSVGAATAAEPDSTAITDPEASQSHEVADCAPSLPLAVNAQGLIDLRISELCDQAIEDHKRSGAWQESAQRNARTITDIFIAENGDLKMSEISRKHLVALTNRLKIMPRIWGKSRSDRAGGLQAVFRRGEELAQQLKGSPNKTDLPAKCQIGFSPATHNRHIDTFKQILDYAHKLEDGHGNQTHVHTRVSFHALKLNDTRKKNTRKPVPTEAEVLTLLSGPIFTGCKNLNDRFTSGSMVIHDGAYWMPLLLTIYGARSNEFCQLPLESVIDQVPMPYFDIGGSAKQSVKTIYSERPLPIAPKLIELGLIDYVQALRSQGEEWLFPEFNLTNVKASKVFRDRVFTPLVKYHFPNGTSQKQGDKDIDTQSMRKVVARVLQAVATQIELGIRQAFLGHKPTTTIEEIYQADRSVEELMPCVLATQKLIEPSDSAERIC